MIIVLAFIMISVAGVIMVNQFSNNLQINDKTDKTYTIKIKDIVVTISVYYKHMNLY